MASVKIFNSTVPIFLKGRSGRKASCAQILSYALTKIFHPPFSMSNISP